jgi:lipopolysaccharide transport system ATP-binding protein
MGEAVIHVENLSKRYRLGLKVNGAKTLSDQLIDIVKAPVTNFRRLTNLSNFSNDDESVFWALHDLNFEVKRGEVLGIIGRNGAGKSTLLKILSRITDPTTGNVKIKGRVASLLEVGTGFHPELTGRENVYMNGTILGMRKREIDKKFDEIVAFSGVDKFIDTPVKFYSSGMKVRLGFAVAAHLDPEILIVDEVLAVGDADFQRKCLGKMDEVAHKEGRTILFVSHNMPAVKTLCTKALLLENGSVKYSGTTNATINHYFKREGIEEGHFEPGKLSSSEKVIVKSVTIHNQNGVNTETFQIGDDLTVNLILESEQEFERPHIGIVIKSNAGSVSVANTMFDGSRTENFRKGENFVSCTFKNLPLLPQEYHLSIGIRASDARTHLTTSKEIGYFVIATRMKDLGIESPFAETIAADSVSPLIPYVWNFGNGNIKSFNILDNTGRLKNLI